MKLNQARGWAGLIFALAFASALTADAVFPATVELTKTHITAYATVLFALFGIEMAQSRWGNLSTILSGALSGAIAAKQDQQESNDD
ncbi:hypothetical protein ACFQJC_04930 [Haloferax namakaokahaiae]|uniref:Holin n=1 Tax=Haloferax namakaokahaiae TaxID=1748331 RepID=A0ABD5ZCM6_9EURY